MEPVERVDSRRAVEEPKELAGLTGDPEGGCPAAPYTARPRW